MSSETSLVAEEEARRYVRALREFWWLLLVAVLVVAACATVNLLTAPGRWWFVWVVFGFGVALAFKAVRLFALRNFLGSEWEERKVREYLEQRDQ